MGSMKVWNPKKSELIKTIIKDDFKTREEAMEFESNIIENHIDDELNENYHIPNKGFHTHGMKWTDESKKKLSESCIGRIPYNKGIPHNKKTITKLKVKAKNRYTLDWFIEKYGNDNGIELYNKRCLEYSKRVQGKCNPMYGKFHSNLSRKKMSENSKKKVLQFSKDDIFIKEWDSLSEAADNNGISISSINAVCDPKRINKTAGGFIWKLCKS